MRELKITKQITNRESRSIEKYLQEVAKQNMVTPEEEVELANRIREGDDNALTKLVNANLRFVVSVAKQYQHSGLKLEDLINEGNIGLIKAAERFDPTKGFKFISYAVWWIRQSILKAITEDSRLIRIPSNRVNDINKIASAYMELEQKYEREPSHDEISEMVDMNSDNIEDVMSYSKKHVSVDAPIGENDDNSTMINVLEDNDTPTPTDNLLKESLKREIEIALSSFPERDAEVIRLLFGLNGEQPMSPEDIGVKLGLSGNRIRQIKDKALRKLKRSSNLKRLKSYL